MKRSIEEKRSDMDSLPFQQQEKLMNYLRRHWNLKSDTMVKSKEMIDDFGDRFQQHEWDTLVAKHIPSKHQHRSPAKKKQRSTSTECLPKGISAEFITEMKQWKRRDICAKMDADGVVDYKEGWSKSRLVELYINTLRSRSNGSQSLGEQLDQQPLPSSCSFRTAPPPPPRNFYPTGAVRRAIAKREQQQKPITSDQQSPNPLVAVKQLDPLQSKNSESKQATDVVMDDAEVAKGQQEVACRQPEKDPLSIDAGNIQTYNSPKRKPISPSIQPGLVSSAKKSFMEKASKSASKVERPLLVQRPFSVFSSNPAQRVEQQDPNPPNVPTKENPETQLPPIATSDSENEDTHTPDPSPAKASVDVPRAFPAMHPTAKSNATKPPASIAKKLKHPLKCQPPLQGKKQALAAQMRAKHREKLPGVASALQPAVLKQSSSKQQKHKQARSAAKLLSSHIKHQTTKSTMMMVPDIQPPSSKTGERLAVKTSKSSKKQFKAPPPTYESYEMTDTDASDYESDDSEAESRRRLYKKKPSWSRSENLLPVVHLQVNASRVDPDELFGRVNTCDLKAMFDHDTPRFRERRNGSGLWSPTIVAGKETPYHRVAGDAA